MNLGDIPFIIKDIQNEMPQHTENKAKIPIGYTKPPKNFMDESARLDNKFLNNHQAEIEELAFRFPEYNLPKWMREYQRKYFLNYGILNHDGFYNEFGDPKGTFYKLSLSDLALIGVVGSGGNIGSTIETTTSTTAFGGSNNLGWLLASREAGGVIDDLYNQIAAHVNLTTSYFIVCYDNTGAFAPNNRQGVTGDISYTADDYILKSVTEFSLATTEVWMASIPNSNSANPWKGSTTGGDHELKNSGYVQPADPFPSGGSTGVLDNRMKIAHS